jgi:hypothetical protein
MKWETVLFGSRHRRESRKSSWFRRFPMTAQAGSRVQGKPAEQIQLTGDINITTRELVAFDMRLEKFEIVTPECGFTSAAAKGPLKERRQFRPGAQRRPRRAGRTSRRRQVSARVRAPRT